MKKILLTILTLCGLSIATTKAQNDTLANQNPVYDAALAEYLKESDKTWRLKP